MTRFPWRRERATSDAASRTPERSGAQHVETTAARDVVMRTDVSVQGAVRAVRTVPAEGLPTLEVTVADDTGSVLAVWSGRRAIGGVTLGRQIIVSGVAVSGRRGVELHNPTYRLLPGHSSE